MIHVRAQFTGKRQSPLGRRAECRLGARQRAGGGEATACIGRIVVAATHPFDRVHGGGVRAFGGAAPGCVG